MALSAIEIAQKQRHLHLLSRVKNNQPLTRRELKELDEYEEMAKKEQRTVKKKTAKKGGKKTARKRSGHVKNKDGRKRDWNKPKKGDAEIAALAKELEAVASIDEQIEKHFDLKKFPRIKAALEDAVNKKVEDLIRQKIAGKNYKDFRRVTLQQLMEITGVKSRKTIYLWTEKGLPREADGSFNLARFMPWFEQYTIEKMPARAVAAANPYQKLRAQKLEADLKLQRNETLDRTEVMAGLIGRHQNLVNTFRHKIEELVMDMHGQPQGRMQELLGKFIDNVLDQQCTVPEELHLPEEVEKLLVELLKKLKGE